MIDICDFCSHRKREEDENGFGEVYCEALKERGKAAFITNDRRSMSIDLSGECDNSFAWNCDIYSIVNAMKWLSDRYNELYTDEFKLMVVRKGNFVDMNRVLKGT